MDSKKKQARLEVLKSLSKKKSSEVHEPVIGDSLKKKKLAKVTVIADDKEGLKEGLTKAQQILKAKLGEKFLSKEDESDDEELEHVCPACEDEGCEDCPEEDAE